MTLDTLARTETIDAHFASTPLLDIPAGEPVEAIQHGDGWRSKTSSDSCRTATPRPVSRRVAWRFWSVPVGVVVLVMWVVWMWRT